MRTELKIFQFEGDGVPSEEGATADGMDANKGCEGPRPVQGNANGQTGSRLDPLGAHSPLRQLVHNANLDELANLTHLNLLHRGFLLSLLGGQLAYKWHNGSTRFILLTNHNALILSFDLVFFSF